MSTILIGGNTPDNQYANLIEEVERQGNKEQGHDIGRGDNGSHKHNDY
jgi:hypothetical protein